MHTRFSQLDNPGTSSRARRLFHLLKSKVLKTFSTSETSGLGDTMNGCFGEGISLYLNEVRVGDTCRATW